MYLGEVHLMNLSFFDGRYSVSHFSRGGRVVKFGPEGGELQLLWEIVSEVLGAPKFKSMCCSIGPQKFMFYCIFKKEFFEGSVVLWDKFFSKNWSKIRYIFGVFFLKKSIFYPSKWSIMVRFWRILMKLPIKLHTGCFSKKFENFRKYLKIWPPNPLKLTFYCIFKKKILAEYVVL